MLEEFWSKLVQPEDFLIPYLLFLPVLIWRFFFFGKEILVAIPSENEVADLKKSLVLAWSEVMVFLPKLFWPIKYEKKMF